MGGAELTGGVHVLTLEYPNLEKDFYLGAVRGDSVDNEWGWGPTREGWTPYTQAPQVLSSCLLYICSGTHY